MTQLLTKKYCIPATLLLFFGLFYISLSIGNHQHFGTNGFDLGIFQQTLYHYAHGKLGPNTIRQVPNLLADHMELLLFLISPFWWFFHSWTLLIIQVIAVLIGAMGVYLLVCTLDPSHHKNNAVLSMILFLIQWSLLQAISFDYHNNTLIIMLLPWLFYFSVEKKWLCLYLGSLLFLCTKETAALLLIALGLGILCSKENIKHGLALLLMGLFWYLISIEVLIPFFGNGTYSHWSYNSLGNSGSDALLFIIKHPLKTLFLLFDQKEKQFFWFYFLISGGLFLIRWPRLMLCALPVIAMKMFSSNPHYWGTLFHYNIELAVLIAIATGWTCLNLGKPWSKLLWTGILGCNLCIVWMLPLHNGLSFPDFVKKSFSPLTSLQQDAYKALEMIPPTVAVSTQNEFIPHLSERTYIYLFPEIKNSEYVLFNTHTQRFYPFSTQKEMRIAINKFIKKREYQTIYRSKNILLYKKINIYSE